MSATTTGVAPLVARGLHRFYRRGDVEVAALKDVSLQVRSGEVVAVVGPSGSGKSTLLAMLAGLDNPDGGQVSVLGQRLSHQRPALQTALRGRHIGVLAQSSGLVEHLTLLGNVRLALRLRRRAQRVRGSSPADAGHPTTPQDLLAALGLAARSDAWPSELSGGETARAGLAVALAGTPQVLLADEPTGEVSRTEERVILELLRALRPAQGATVLVTHSAAVAAAADRVVEIVDGRIR